MNEHWLDTVERALELSQVIAPAIPDERVREVLDVTRQDWIAWIDRSLRLVRESRAADRSRERLEAIAEPKGMAMVDVQRCLGGLVDAVSDLVNGSPEGAAHALDDIRGLVIDPDLVVDTDALDHPEGLDFDGPHPDGRR